jgi:hypothetical protein
VFGTLSSEGDRAPAAAIEMQNVALEDGEENETAVAEPALSAAHSAVRRGQERKTRRAKEPSRWLVAFSGAAVALMHAVPIGIVQFADYASDLGVIGTFATSSRTALEKAMASDPDLFLNCTVDLDFVIPPILPPLGLDTARDLAATGQGCGADHNSTAYNSSYAVDSTTVAYLEQYIADEISFRTGLGCIIASVSCVWIAAIGLLVVKCVDGDFETEDTQELCWLFTAALLSPLNLHVLYLAVVVAQAKAKLSVLSSSVGGAPELWQAYDAAKEAVNIAYQRGDTVEKIKEALKVALAYVAISSAPPDVASMPRRRS